ncbi:protein unc-13 homolog isoform X5, partial [Tanacetum coccineum]
EWNIIITPAERVEHLLAIRQVASSLSSIGRTSQIQGGSSYWNAGYHLNISLYESLAPLTTIRGVQGAVSSGSALSRFVDFQPIHMAGWFVETKEMPLLDQANLQVQKVLSTNYKEGNEEQFTYTIMCTDADNGTEIRLSLEQAIFRSINLWCDARLQDYHLHFSEVISFLLSSSIGVYLVRASNSINEENGVGSLSIQEFDFYQISLNMPYDLILEGRKCFHLGGVGFVLWDSSVCLVGGEKTFIRISRSSSILLSKFLGCRGGMQNQEQITTLLSMPTVDQLFKLSLPMDISHLQALLSIIFHALDGYLLKLVSQLVEKNHLYPAAPPLTRHKEAMFPIAKKKVVESLLLDEEVDEKLKGLTAVKLCVRLNTLQYLQKQINVLEDGIKKSWAEVKFSNVQKSNFNSVLPAKIPPGTTDHMLADSESVDELFVATFDSIRDSVAGAIRNICDLIGTRIIFWDLRDSFLFRLYHGTVEGARLENLFPQIDSVLNHVCGLIDDTLRDMVVASVCRAALEGYVWVLLDGGPACAFSDSDITMMEEDLNILKVHY